MNGSMIGRKREWTRCLFFLLSGWTCSEPASALCLPLPLLPPFPLSVVECCAPFSKRPSVTALQPSLVVLTGLIWSDMLPKQRQIRGIEIETAKSLSYQYYFFLLPCFSFHTSTYIPPIYITYVHCSVTSTVFPSLFLLVCWRSHSVASTSLHSWEAEAL